MINGQQKPVIEYPLEWQYKLIGSDQEGIQSAIQQTLPERKHQVAFSQKSSRGSYFSMNLYVIVQNEDDRNNLYRLFNSHPAIKMVM